MSSQHLPFWSEQKFLWSVCIARNCQWRQRAAAVEPERCHRGGGARQGAPGAPSPPRLLPRHSPGDGSPLALRGGIGGEDVSLHGGCPSGMINGV